MAERRERERIVRDDALAPAAPYFPDDQEQTVAVERAAYQPGTPPARPAAYRERPYAK